jgi:hypothetical protein
MGFRTGLDSVTERIIPMLAEDRIPAIQPVMGQLTKVLLSYPMLCSLDTDSILNNRLKTEEEGKHNILMRKSLEKRPY